MTRKKKKRVRSKKMIRLLERENSLGKILMSTLSSSKTQIELRRQ